MKTHVTRVLAGAAAFIALLAGTVVGASAASAATIPGAITNVQVEQDSARTRTEVQVNLDWSVPNDSQPGDTFTLQLPPELATFTTAFQLTHDDGSVVANATVSPSGLATFTLTDFVTTHPLDVHGSAHFWTTFNSDAPDGTSVPLTFTTDDVTFNDAINVIGAPILDHTNPMKAGAWTDVDDQGTRTPDGALRWSVASPFGPLDSLTFEDPAQPGQEVDCSAPILMRATTTTDALGYLTNLATVPASDYTVTCTPQKLTVTMNRPVVQNEIVQVTFQNTITDPSLDTYRNTATVSAAGKTWQTSASVKRQASGGEGTGSGMGPLAITKVVEGTGTPSGSFTILVDCQWAGRQAPGYPQTLTFTGAETKTLSAPISSVCTATETVNGGATRVDVSPAATVTDAATGTSKITVTNTFETTPPDENPPTDPPATPENPKPAVKPAAAQSLALTGGNVPMWMIAAGAGLALAGMGVLTAQVVRSRRAGAETK